MLRIRIRPKENQGPRSPAPLSPDRYKKKRRWELTDEEDSQESRDKVGNTEIESSSVEEPLCTPTDAAPDSSQGGSLGGGSMRLPLFATPGAANQSSGRPPRRGGGGGGSKGAGKGGGGFSAPRYLTLACGNGVEEAAASPVPNPNPNS
jgi:hypothetical protein